MKSSFHRIKIYGKKWEKLANQLARDFVPSIYPCKKCGYPHIKGYCCTFCKDANPESSEE